MSKQEQLQEIDSERLARSYGWSSTSETPRQESDDENGTGTGQSILFAIHQLNDNRRSHYALTLSP
jgi:hypothetical protein